MKKTFIATLSVALAMAVALPAGAKPSKCETDPAAPGCNPAPEEEVPFAGPTCVAQDPLARFVDGEDFVVELGGRDTGLDGYECIDVMSTEAGRWNITVTGNGALRLLLVPRDSDAPGDSCGGVDARRTVNIYGSFTLPLDIPEETRSEIPAATVNACGTNWPEWIEEYPGTQVPAPWDAAAICGDAGVPCSVGTAMPDQPHPLVLQAAYEGSHDGTVRICVDLPPHDPSGEPPTCN